MMTRRTIILGLAGSLVSLPLSLGTHAFLSDPEEVAQQLTEWSLQGDLLGFINPSGAVVIPFQFADAGDFSNGQAEVTLRQDHHSVRIDPSGRILPDPEDEDDQDA